MSSHVTPPHPSHLIPHEGVMIFGSGQATHNMQELFAYMSSPTVPLHVAQSVSSFPSRPLPSSFSPPQISPHFVFSPGGLIGLTPQLRCQVRLNGKTVFSSGPQLPLPARNILVRVRHSSTHLDSSQVILHHNDEPRSHPSSFPPHPSLEHLIPLHVVAGAGGNTGRKIFGQVTGAMSLGSFLFED